jgi:glycosyltransferase involved in cell wall biosynthesis
MPGTVLHILSQRPGRTGSGTTLDALVREAAAAGWDQHVVVGVPRDESPAVGGLDPSRVHPLRFGDPPLDFAVPGMSDVMPYPSTRFSSMDEDRVARYRDGWREHLRRVIETTRPAVIHSHHVWLVSALLKDVAPRVPVVTHGHGTGIRQAALCPHLVELVRRGCSRNESFAVLHADHARSVAQLLEIEPQRIHVVGAGYREDVFHARARTVDGPPRVIYAGKLSRAKGLGPLLDAWPRVESARAGAELHVAGGGDGEESDRFRDRLARMGPGVRHHGPLAPAALAELMRSCTVCVLPSYFEGLPLVLVEALACGCRLVATDLPGVRDAIAPHVGSLLETVPLPGLETVDTPLEAGIPGFVDALVAAVIRALDRPVRSTDAGRTAAFTWSAVFRRIEPLWESGKAGRLAADAVDRTAER